MSILFERGKICNSDSLRWIPLQFQNIIFNFIRDRRIEFRL